MRAVAYVNYRSVESHSGVTAGCIVVDKPYGAISLPERLGSQDVGSGAFAGKFDR